MLLTLKNSRTDLAENRCGGSLNQETDMEYFLNSFLFFLLCTAAFVVVFVSCTESMILYFNNRSIG